MADFADDLHSLADKAYADLPLEALERLAINAYLQQLSHPQVAFSVKQRRPMTLDEVVVATLEMESYVSGPDRAGITAVEVEDETAAVATVSPIDKLTRTVEHLAKRVETLQSEVAGGGANAIAPRRLASTGTRHEDWAGADSWVSAGRVIRGATC